MASSEMDGRRSPRTRSKVELQLATGHDSTYRTSVCLALNCCCPSFDCGPEDPDTPFAIFLHICMCIYTRGWKRVCVYLTCLKSHLVCNQAKQIWAHWLRRRFPCDKLSLRMGKLKFRPSIGNSISVCVSWRMWLLVCVANWVNCLS